MLVTRPYEPQGVNEIDLLEGEYIYNVEQFDDGWWRGKTVDGKIGLFPNYCVEEIAGSNQVGVPLLALIKAAPNTVTSGMQELSIHFANHRRQHQIHPQQQQRQEPQQHQEKDRISVMAIPSMEVVANQLVIGNAQSSEYSPLPPSELARSAPTSYSVRTLLHLCQGRRRRTTRPSLALRLAFTSTTPCHASANATDASGMERKASRRYQAHEKALGRRLGRM